MQNNPHHIRKTLVLVLGLIALASPQRYRDKFLPGNEGGRVHAAMAIVDHRSVHLDSVWDDLYPGWRDTGWLPNDDAARREGHFLLDKPPGVTLLTVPVIGAMRATGTEMRNSNLFWMLALLFAALPSLWFLLIFLRWIRENLGDGRAAVLVAPALVFASPWLLFGSQLVAHTLAAALVGIGAFLALGRLSAADPGARPRRGAFLGGLSLGCAVLAEASSALLVLGVMLALLSDSARRRRLPWLILGGLGPALVFLIWNAVSFGDPLTYGYAHKVTASMAAAHGRGVLGIAWPSPEGLFGLLFSARRGLFYLAPWLLLAPIGALWALRDREIARAWRILVLVGTLLVPLILSGFADWHGGHTFGPRYLIFALPMFGVGAALAVDRLQRGRFGRPALGAVAGLGASSLAIQLVALASIPASPPEVANPVFELLLPVIGGGGPVGTIWDPLVGAIPGILLTAAAVVGVFVAFTGFAWRPTRVAGGLLALAFVVHLGTAAIPRTGGPDARMTVLSARSGAFFYLGRDDFRRKVEAEMVRIRRESSRRR